MAPGNWKSRCNLALEQFACKCFSRAATAPGTIDVPGISHSGPAALPAMVCVSGPRTAQFWVAPEL